MRLRARSGGCNRGLGEKHRGEDGILIHRLRIVTRRKMILKVLRSGGVGWVRIQRLGLWLLLWLLLPLLCTHLCCVRIRHRRRRGLLLRLRLRRWRRLRRLIRFELRFIGAQSNLMRALLGVIRHLLI